LKYSLTVITLDAQAAVLTMAPEIELLRPAAVLCLLHPWNHAWT